MFPTTDVLALNFTVYCSIRVECKRVERPLKERPYLTLALTRLREQRLTAAEAALSSACYTGYKKLVPDDGDSA
jgi:hypothetical protein